MPAISSTLAEFVHKLSYNDLNEDNIFQVKRFLIDTFGCALAGSRVEDTEIAIKVYRDFGGKEECSIIGHDFKTSSYYASFLNSLAARAMDYNDIYWKADPSHPSDIIPAAMAIAEARHLSAKEFIVAVIIAYEIEMRLCEFAEPGIRERGWHHATLTQFASPFAAGKLIGLDVDGLVRACGISGCHNLTLGGAVAGKLTMMKNTVDPLAAQSGVMAALMAEGGYTGTEEVFEGKEGLFHCLGDGWDVSKLTGGLGDRFKIGDCSMKAFPTEALTHSPISATLEVVKENNIQAEDVKEVTIRTIRRAADILADPSKYKPESKETADHSLPYCIAAAIADHQVTPKQFKDEKLRDPRIRGLLNKIKAVADEGFENAFPAKQCTEVTIELNDGNKYSKKLDFPQGDPRNPMDKDQLETKYNSLASTVFGDVKRKHLLDACYNLETFDDFADFMKLTV
ncbi:MAG: MmgE/PrpD family protein [candidate division Zixibacteria bacterium]|nr:MmgE/PrpD family protein [candidate division Zixibacteria bacterium]